VNVKGLGHIILGLIMLLCTQGCGGTKNVKSSGKTEEKEIENFWIRNVGVSTCEEGKSVGRLGIRYVRDSVVVLVLRNKTGMEGARIYIYQDKVYIFNRVKKKYYKGELDTKNTELGMSVGEFLYRKNTIKKYFEFVMGKNNGVRVYVKGYRKVGKGYVPDDMKIKMLWEGKVYCLKMNWKEIKENARINVARIDPEDNYVRVNKVNDVF